MNKRVHQIAKERGIPARDVLARLKAAGIDVTAASSSVDEELASRVLANGHGAADQQAAPAPEKASKPAPLREAEAGRREGARRQGGQGRCA